MAKNCFVERGYGKSYMLTNGTGAEVALNEFCILGRLGAVADGVVANGASGGFEVGGYIHTSHLTTGADTFGTANALVYFDNSAKTFGDTAAIGLYIVGQVAKVKTNGVVEIKLFDTAELVPTFAALADVDVAGVTNNDTLKYVTATGKWTDVAVAD